MSTIHMESDTAPAVQELTADKLAQMKLEAREFFSEPGTPTGRTHRANPMDYQAQLETRSVAGGRRSSRTFSRSTRRSSSFITSHRNKMSMELTSSAESKFFALIELMASASREASSLKEVWAKIISERESWAEEREELLEQVTEISQEMERREAVQQRNLGTSIESKKKVEKLLLDLSIAVSGVTAEKKKVADRDHHLGAVRRELLETKETMTRHIQDLERVRSEHESIVLTLKTAEGDRDSIRDEADRLRRGLNKTTRERTEFSSKVTELTTKHETIHRESLALVDRVKMYDIEREEHILVVERLKEEIRKTKLRADESAKDLIEVTERSDRVHREVEKFRESIKTIELERDELAHTIEHLRRDNKTHLTNFNESENRFSEVNLRYEHLKRELLSTKDKLREIEIERNEQVVLVERTRESHNLLSIERDELREAINIAERKHHDSNRRVTVLEESLRRSEVLLSEVRSEVTNLTQRIKHITVERDDARHKHGHLSAEIVELKEKIIVFQAEIRSITEIRDGLRSDLEKTRAEYEEITETMTSYEDGSGELEFEIESLRTLLHEAREQKERAISARNSADKERDEHIAKYEEKCRELERFEESAASHYHAHAHSSSHSGGKMTSTRVVSSRSNATQIHNGN